MRVSVGTGHRTAITLASLGAAATIAIAVLAGAGIWIVAALGGCVLGAVVALCAVYLTDPEREHHGAALSADVDLVSGLPTVERLHDDLVQALGADGFGAALHVCILHGMGQYNDAYGEACGDAMISWQARKLRDAVGERGSVYRLRGASFAVSASLAEPVDGLSLVCAKALLEVGEGFMIRGVIGRALLPEEAATGSAGLELATRRAIAERATKPGDSELRPPDDPMEVMPLERPRYQVAEVAARIGRRMGLAAADLDVLEAAAHLRDVGNMALPSAVLTRTGELPRHEWEFVRLHTIVGERLLAANFEMERVARLVRSSHERWDGGGYPDGLSATDIPLGARILFVCSAFQDMTSVRAHRAARDAAQALDELSLGAGTQFDPDVVTAFHEEFGGSDEPGAQALGRRGRRPLHVLVADDDAASRFLLARAIDAAGQLCTTAEDGLTAWRLFRRVRPDVVICDSRLPKINAERLCRRIRHEEEERQTYFVTLVALQEDDAVRRDPDAGADDFLAKPFDREDLDTLLTAAFNEVSLRQDLG
jgi:response regulator RpfG family c-di-GMP phosphodiesterase/GGDEF domain-containing protein